ncbi:MAG: winged helix-turn-helix domain-containing protein [Cohaesibacter sp.]|nr:winged helix-turn-helix domain-containing protein [Cohaesibacter sp.]
MGDQVNDETVYKTVSELAEMAGVSKPAISKRLKKLENAGLALKKNERGHVVGVPLAHYEELTGAILNPNKVAAGREQSPKKPADDGPPKYYGPAPGSLEEKKLEEAQLNIDRKKRQEALDMGQLVRVDQLKPALLEAGKTIQAGINRLENKADDFCIAAEKGPHAARLKLKEFAAEINDLIAKALDDLAAQSPEGDPPL